MGLNNKKKLILIPSALNVYNEMSFEVGSIPHILVPINGKPLLYYLIEDFDSKNPNNDYLIIGKENIHLINHYVKENLKNASNIKVVEIDELKGLGWTILQGLRMVNNLADYDEVVINFGDTYIKDFSFKDKDTVYYSIKEESYRWTTFRSENNKITSIKDKNINDFSKSFNNIFVGVFIIKYPAVFSRCLENNEDFYLALMDYLNEKEYILEETKDWYDFGHVDNYYDAKKSFINKRFFNTLHIDSNRAICKKKSDDIEKFINEIKWYLGLPDDLQYLVPRIFNYSLNPEDMFIEMEYYGYPSLSDLYLLGNYEVGLWNKIFDSIFFSIDEMSKYKLDLKKEELVDAVIDMYIEKTKKRVSLLKKDDFFGSLVDKEMTINSVKYPSFNSMSKDLEKISKNVLSNGLKFLSIIHGDLCLPNMLYDPKQKILKLIDPRGKFSKYKLYGDFKYDLGKLRHSFIGNYDFIINDLFSLHYSDEKVDYKFFKSQNQKNISELFEFRLNEKYPTNSREIELIEALLFINMVPLHSDNRNRQIVMWSIGIEKIHSVLEKYKQDKTKVIITMAGEGSRFRQIGIDKPKYMIDARGKTLFEWSIRSLTNFFDYEFIFITRKEHNSRKFIEEKCKSLGIKKFKIKELDYLTEGQAATVLTAKEFLSMDDPILIYNIDTYVEPHELKPGDITGDGWVPSFEAVGDHWSFVSFDNNYKVNNVAEKIRISDYGTIGLYYFSSLGLFESVYQSFNFEGIKEKYIAPLYSRVIKDDSKAVFTRLIDKNSIHELGTPDEVKKFDPDFLKNNNRV